MIQTAYNTKDKIEAKTITFFLDTVDVNEECRYKACLPLKEVIALFRQILS